MKNIEMLNKAMVIKNIPLVMEGRELPSKLQAKLMLMRVSFDKAASAYNDKLQEVLKGLKPEGFDELAQKIQRMDEIEKKDKAFKEWNNEGEKPSEPTKEELVEAAKIREENFGEYKEMEHELLSKYNEAYNQELYEESEMKDKKFTEDEFASIIDVIKSEGEIDFVGNDGKKFELKRVELIGMIASLFVEE